MQVSIAYRQQQWLKYKPSISELMQIGEDNYLLIRRLISDLKQLPLGKIALNQHQIPLELTILEQTKYTTLFILTHRINKTSQVPNAKLRAFHDAHQLELLHLDSQVYKVNDQYHAPALFDKIQASRFINRWLHYCEQITQESINK